MRLPLVREVHHDHRGQSGDGGNEIAVEGPDATQQPGLADMSFGKSEAGRSRRVEAAAIKGSAMLR